MLALYHMSDLYLHQDNSKNQQSLALLRRIRDEVKFGPSDFNYLV